MKPAHFQFGAFTLYPSNQLLLRESERIPLAPKLFDLLVYMVAHRGRLLTRDELMKAVWSATVVEESNLTVNVSLLRKILGNAPDGKPYIETVPRRGYRFHPGVLEIVPEDERAPHPVVVLKSARPAAPAVRDPPWSLNRFALVLIVGLSVGVAAYYLVMRPVGRAPPPIAVNVGAPRSLAVLPFQNLKRAAADDFLGFALADAVITKLGYVSHLSVRPSSSVARFEKGAIEPQTIAKELKVDTLLTGTYAHDAADLRITAQLVEAATQRLLWSSTINVKYENLLGVQDRVAQEIVAGLQVPLSAPEAARLSGQRFAKADAYEKYLKGVDFYAMNQFELSIRALEDSARIDPDFPLTWAMLGRAYTTDASLHFGGSQQYGKALSAYQNALHLDPAQIEPRVYMANLLTDTGRVEDALPLLQEALTLNPNHAEANWEVGYAYRFAGALEASVVSAELARRLDPSVKLNSSAINGYLYLGRYEDFLASLPTGNANAFIVFYRGFAEYHLGRLLDAQQDFDRAFELDASILQTQVGKALSKKLKGDVRGGLISLHGTEEKLIQTGVIDAEGLYKVAQAYAQLNDSYAALRVLEKSIDGGFFCYPYIQRDPLLAPLRAAAGLPRLLEKARLRYESFKARLAPDSST